MSLLLQSKWALITGATAGIGEATAKALASKKVNLIITGRRIDRLKSLKEFLELNHSIQVEVAAFDIQDESACSATLLPLLEKHKIEILINNSGLALGVESLSDGKTSDWSKMIDTNIKGLLYVTRLVLQQMVKNKAGHIVNLGSVAGRWVYPGGAVYCATKFAVRGLSEALRLDLMGTPIRVTNIEPGMVETEFSEVRLQDKEKAKKVYQGVKPLSPEDIAETIVWSLERPAHVNIQEMVVFPTQQAGVGPAYTYRGTT